MIAPGLANKTLAPGPAQIPFVLKRPFKPHIYPDIIKIPAIWFPLRPGRGRSVVRPRGDSQSSASKRRFWSRLKRARTSVMQAPEGFLSLSFRLDLANYRR